MYLKLRKFNLHIEKINFEILNLIYFYFLNLSYIKTNKNFYFMNNISLSQSFDFYHNIKFTNIYLVIFY
jgi:hypothetical protein